MKNLKLILATLISIGFLAEASAQKIRTYTNNEEDSMKCLNALSLYGEYFKQKNYTDAVIGWRDAVAVCPKSRESLYIYGTTIYGEFYKKEKDKAKKAAYLDTIMWIYDKRIEHFGNEAFVLGRKGGDYLKYNPSDPEKAFEILKKSFEMAGNETEPIALVYMYQAAYTMYKKDLMSREALIALYPELMSVVRYHHKTFGDAGKKKYAIAEENLDKIFAPIADCPDLEALFAPKFKETPNDPELINQIVNLLNNKECFDSELYIAAARKKYDLDPDALAAYKLANWYLAKSDWNEAKKFFSETIERVENDDDLKYKALIRRASCNLALKQYSSTKSDAFEAIKLDGQTGEPYLLIGDAYAYGGKEIGGNECTSRAGYWAAVDKYYKAKAIDPSLAEKADKKIATATNQFPGKENCFFHGLSEGESYTIGGWINETTKIRFN